jgi:hypothetical protein
MNRIVIEDGFAILPGVKGMVTFDRSDDAAKPSFVVPEEITSARWSSWGDSNTFPQDVLADLELNSIAMRALEKRANVHFGRGISIYRMIDGERVEVESEPVNEFFNLNRVNLQWIDLIKSLEIFANGWVEFIMNKAGTKINRVFIKDPCYCRWEMMNESTGRIENMYYSARWPTPSDEYFSKIPTFNPYKHAKGQPYKDKKFVYPVFYKSFNKSYYHMAVWHGIRKGGWLDIANKVPKLKLAIMKNQMIIKYHVQIPDKYFEKRWPADRYDEKTREAKKQDKINELNAFLSDVENSGKSLVTFTFFDEWQKEHPGWKITTIDNKLKDDAYLPDSQAANSEFLFSSGVDPSIVGSSGVPGGKMASSGSGSDKREAFWMLNAEMGPYRSVSLEPLYFLRDFNGWDPSIRFDYTVVDTSQTQDEHPTKTEKRIDQNQQ